MRASASKYEKEWAVLKMITFRFVLTNQSSSLPADQFLQFAIARLFYLVKMELYEGDWQSQRVATDIGKLAEDIFLLWFFWSEEKNPKVDFANNVNYWIQPDVT